MRRILLSLALVLLLGCAQGTSEDRIKYGWIGPLTGGASTFGETGYNAAKIAVDELNADGGINDRLIDLIAEDGKCDGATAVTAAHKLIDIDRVDVIFGGHCSTESMAIQPVAAENEVFQLASTTSTPAYAGKAKYALRTTPPSSYVMKIQAQEALNRGINKVWILYEQKDYPLGVITAFSQYYEALGGKILAKDSFPPGTIDLKTQLEKFQQSDADALMVGVSNQDPAVILFRQAKELNITKPILGETLLISKATWDRALDAMPSTAWGVTTHTDPNANELTKSFLSRYRSQYGEFGVDPALVAESYDAVMIYSDALKKCGDDKDCIKANILSIKNRESAVGTLSYTAEGEPSFDLAVVRIVDGKPVFDAVGEKR